MASKKQAPKRKAGRPLHPLPKRMQLRHTPEQLAAWNEAARREQRELPSWIRYHLDRLAAGVP